MKHIFLIVSILFLWSPSTANTITDICKENFDKKIKLETQQKNDLEKLISESKDKMDDVRKASEEIDKFSKTIRMLIKTNLIKSTLKLGYDTYQELQPLNGIEGKLAEVSKWVTDKANSYAIGEGEKVLGLTTKDYYNKHLKLIEDSLKNITPEVKLLNQMLDAGLEAFKIKMLRENNQTVGDIGALYFKLKSLADQSVKAKKSLYRLYLDLYNLTHNGEYELSHIDNIIDTYKEAKNKTCKENKEIEIEKEELTINPPYRFTQDPPYVAYQPNKDECSDVFHTGVLEKKRDEIYSLIKERNTTKQLFIEYFNQEFKNLTSKVYDFENSENNKSIVLYKTIFISELCYQDDKLKLDSAYNKTLSNYNSNVSLFKNYLDSLINYKSFADDFLSQIESSSQFKELVKKDTIVNNKVQDYYAVVKSCDLYDTNSFTATIIDGISDNIHNNVKNFYQEYLKKIDKVKLNLEYVKEMKSLISDEYKVWKLTLKNDQIDLESLSEKLNEKIKLYSSLDESLSSLLSYIDQEAQNGLIIKSLYYEEGINTTYIAFRTNWKYIEELYKNYSGDTISFVEMLKDMLREFNTKTILLINDIEEQKNLISTISETEQDVLGIASQWTHPAVNLDSEFSTATRLGDIVEKKRMKFTIVRYSSRVTDLLLGGELAGDIPFLLTINAELEKERTQIKLSLNSSLERIQVYETIEDFQNFKELISKAENFQYKLGNSLYLNEEEYINTDNLIETSKQSLKKYSRKQLNNQDAVNFDLNSLNLNCKDSLLELNISKDVLTIVGTDTENVSITIDSCDDSNLTLEAKVVNDIEHSIDIESDWLNIKIDSYTGKSKKIYITNKYNQDKIYDINLKLHNTARAIYTKNIKLNVISSTRKLFIKEGWNLIGGNVNFNTLPLEVDIVWLYKNNTWYARSPHESINNEIKDKSIFSNMKMLDFTNNNDGAWIHTINDTYIDIARDIEPEDGKIHIYEKGWSIVNTSADINTISQIVCDNSKFISAVTYLKDNIQNDFKIYTNDTNNTSINIGKDSGLWVLCQ